jgi:hypothetical protein
MDTHPTCTVLLQSYNTEEFDLPEGVNPTMPADDDGQILIPCDPIDGVKEEEQSSYRTAGVSKLLLIMMRWSRPDILNPVPISTTKVLSI